MSRESPYIARLSGHTVLISPAHAEVVTPGANLRITFEGANTAAPISALEPMGGKVNYLIGADRSDWHGGVSTWGKVRVEQLYPGIDLIYHGEGRQFEYDFAVAPGSNSSIIKIRVEGSGQVRLNANGDAVLTTGSASITMRAPRLYQQISGERRQVEGAYHQDGSNLLSFIVGNYDRTQPLVIDPVLLWGGTIGGVRDNFASSIAVDALGNSYVVGYGVAEISSGTAEHVLGSSRRINYVAKLDARGALVWLSYSDLFPYPSYIAVDSKGSVWLGAAGLIYKLSPAGDAILANAAFSDSIVAIAIDAAENVYVAATSHVYKLAPDGAQLFSLSLSDLQAGGQITGITCNPSGNVYIAGTTAHIFTGVRSIGQFVPTSYYNAFAASVKSDGSGLAWAAYVEGIAKAVAADKQGNVWFGGFASGTTLPVTTHALYFRSTGSSFGFLAKIDSAGTVFKFLSSFPDPIAFLTVAADGSVFAAGGTLSADFPLVHAVEDIAPASVATLFETTDGGRSWRASYPALPGNALAVSADPSTPDTLVAVTTSGIYLSTNGGRDWVSQGSYNFTRSSLVRDPGNSSIIWAGGDSLMRSGDGGRTWILIPDAGGEDMSPFPGNPNLFFSIDLNSQLNRSNFENGFWNSQPIQIFFGNTDIATAVRAAGDGSLYVGNLGFGLLKVGGLLDHTFPSSWIGLGPLFGSVDIRSLDTSTTNPQIVYAVTDGTLFRSQDGGNSWVTGEISPSGGLTRIRVAPSNDQTVYGVATGARNCGMVTVTNDGGHTWSTPSPDLALSCITDISVSPINPKTAWAIATRKFLGFVAHVTADGSSFVYSSLLSDVPTGVATNGTDVFLSGTTRVGQFVTAESAVATGDSGTQAAFVERITDASPPCTVAVTPSAAYAWSPEVPLSFSVVAPGGCVWTISGEPAWISVPSGTSGSGAGLVTLIATPDPTAASRTATFTIGGEPVSVTSAGASCTYSLAPDIATVEHGGGAAQFTVVTGAGCPWNITGINQPDLTLQSAASGFGTAKITFALAANPSALPHANLDSRLPDTPPPSTKRRIAVTNSVFLAHSMVQ